jgi:hypothetical protein
MGSPNDVALLAISENRSANLLFIEVSRMYGIRQKQGGSGFMSRASDREALKLVIAFLCIMEPAKRAEILAIAERYAEASQIVDAKEALLKLRQRSAPSDDS